MAIKKLSEGLYLITVSFRVSGCPYPKQKAERFRGLLREAKAREAELKNSLLTPVPSSLTTEPIDRTFSSGTDDPQVRTFGEAVDLYVENLKVRGKDSPHHIKRYDFLKRTYGEFSLQDVPARLLKWRGEVQQSHSNSIINGYTIMIRAVFNYLLALELIQKNPITKLRFPKLETKPRDRYLDDAERGLLLKTIAEHRPQILPIILYMLLVPCRVSELVFAKREQYNPDTNTVYIPDSKADMPIYKPVPECLRGYFQSIPVDCPHLFYKQVGERYYIHHNLRHDWGYVLKKAGILDLRLHDLRHISSSDLYELGNLEREIMDIAGWKTPMLTHYRHKNSLRSAQKIIFKAN